MPFNLKHDIFKDLSDKEDLNAQAQRVVTQLLVLDFKAVRAPNVKGEILEFSDQQKNLLGQIIPEGINKLELEALEKAVQKIDLTSKNFSTRVQKYAEKPPIAELLRKRVIDLFKKHYVLEKELKSSQAEVKEIKSPIDKKIFNFKDPVLEKLKSSSMEEILNTIAGILIADKFYFDKSNNKYSLSDNQRIFLKRVLIAVLDDNAGNLLAKAIEKILETAGNKKEFSGLIQQLPNILKEFNPRADIIVLDAPGKVLRY